MKRLLRFLLSRSFLLAVLALLQIGVFIALALNFARLGTVFYTVVTIVSALCAVLVFEKTNTNPAYKMMWMLIILLMPMTGVDVYKRQTYRLRKIRTKKGLPLAACVPPVLVNAVIVGAEITYIFMPETASLPVLGFNIDVYKRQLLPSCFRMAQSAPPGARPP